MDTQEKNHDALLIKGFNSGYTLAHHQPELLATILKGANQQQESEPASPYLTGLIKGKEQYEKDKARERQAAFEKEKAKLLQQKNATKDKGKDRD